MPCLVLPCLVCFVLSCFVCLVLSRHALYALSCLVCLVLSRLAWYTLSCLTLPCMPCLVLPCMPCLAMPCFACLILPCLVLHALSSLIDLSVYLCFVGGFCLACFSWIDWSFIFKRLCVLLIRLVGFVAAVASEKKEDCEAVSRCRWNEDELYPVCEALITTSTTTPATTTTGTVTVLPTNPRSTFRQKQTTEQRESGQRG